MFAVAHPTRADGERTARFPLLNDHSAGFKIRVAEDRE
jgi:hypothetical protein